MIREAVSYPFKGDEWYVEGLIGGGLLLLYPIFIIIDLTIDPRSYSIIYLTTPALTIFVTGFYLRVARAAGADIDSRPKFNNGKELFIDGVKTLLIGVIFFLPSVSIWLGGAYFRIYVISGFGILLFLITSYVAPIALTNFAIEDQFSSGFDFKAIKNAGISKRYVKAFIPYSILVYTLGRFFPLIDVRLLIDPQLMLVVLAIINFYMYYIATYLIASGCGPQLTAVADS
ncbi:DUF4013 domain-containing protein [Natrinema halophilum]|uniref:DUF4013 domain-containing protein n=1 Tax=Natrinema halophilum TaxID=1699371 RepID=A0A7D5GLN8_9EURY|nr:DUF4013 domain-containing protein [Natrinema halophilum]QLG50070.1 DUF4013 domain-containing protein [Natrinema halophilum]